MSYSYNQGIYEIKNKDKYIGTKNPRYLSSYELEFFRWADNNAGVLKWGAEVVVVPYMNPSKVDQYGNMKKSRYIVDIYVKYKTKTGEIKEELIEIKPYQQLSKPKRGKKKQHWYDQEVLTYQQNCAKWEAAKKYAESKGMKFKILTEQNIFKR